MSQYRWFLINELFWSLVFDTMCALISAVTLFPLPCFYGVNGASSLDGTQRSIYFFIGVYGFLAKCFAYIFQFHYRAMQAIPPDNFFQCINISHFSIGSYLAVYLVAVTVASTLSIVRNEVIVFLIYVIRVPL